MFDILKSLLISFVVVAVLLPVVRYALRRMSPAGNVPALSPDEVAYAQKQDRKLTFFYYIFACILAVICTGGLALLSSIIHMSREHLYVLTPNFRAMFAPGLLLGLTLATLPLRAAQKSLLGQEYDLYKTYMRQQEGANSVRAYYVLLVIMLVLSCVAAWFALRWHVVVSAKELTITNLLQQESTYRLEAIKEIRYLGKEGEYLISFTDQTSINTAYLKPVNLEMIALLAERSGTRVIR
ncbi:hypothetical protein [Botryobacter ruber]|uniref:hypothetical protein n=1 Tax=Botryobacter ruber TaxID=2171629 RepID=UPI000E0BC611|nr:hypothetical protein [Botryobacter ruber]